MSWIPPSAVGLYDPQSARWPALALHPTTGHPNQPPPKHTSALAAGRHAPRPAASAPLFTFGHLDERRQQGCSSNNSQPHAAPPREAISQRPDKACFDPPAAQLHWWQQPRSAATVSGSCNRDVEVYWEGVAGKDSGVESLVNQQARHKNKEQGLNSTIAASLGDRQEYDLTPQVKSLYQSDLCGTHVRVGKRGVAQPKAAMAAVSLCSTVPVHLCHGGAKGGAACMCWQVARLILLHSANTMHPPCHPIRSMRNLASRPSATRLSGGPPT